MRAYRVLENAVSRYFDPGTVLYEFRGVDWNLRDDHEHRTGKPHINLSLTGGVPFVTVPRSDVESVLVSNYVHME